MYLGDMNMTEENISQEVAYYNGLSFIFEDFMVLSDLSDGIIRLVCTKKHFVDFYEKWMPAYEFEICTGDAKVGDIRLRIGYSEGIYYSGHIGFAINEEHRRNGYAALACRLIASVARYHEMKKLLITNDDGNIASYRVCEKLGAKFVRKADLPNWHDAYKKGHRYKNIFEWNVHCLHKKTGKL